MKRTNSSSFGQYAQALGAALDEFDWGQLDGLATALRQAWRTGHEIFLCGNGGSAANALHLANDLLYGVAKRGAGIKVTALPANPAMVTCLGNDLGYENIFSRQLQVLGRAGDVLIVLSGSGNSPNVIRALKQAKTMKIQTFAILGFDGGQCLKLSDHAIHFSINDMQISEDLQLIVGHMLMQELCRGSRA